MSVAREAWTWMKPASSEHSGALAYSINVCASAVKIALVLTVLKICLVKGGWGVYINFVFKKAEARLFKPGFLFGSGCVQPGFNMPTLAHPERKSSEDFTGDRISARKPPIMLPASIGRILTESAQRFGVTASMVQNGSQEASVVAARRMTAFALRKLGLSTPLIGRYLGRSHTSVLYLLGRTKKGATVTPHPAPEVRQAPCPYCGTTLLVSERSLDSVAVPDLSGEWAI
jgi:hypothetical protein